VPHILLLSKPETPHLLRFGKKATILDHSRHVDIIGEVIVGQKVQQPDGCWAIFGNQIV
jgi:hypothetical protein